MTRAWEFAKRLRTETLEPKRLLAGDVMASLDGNVLEILGDAEGNEIVISAALDEQGEVIADSFIVTGLDGTTVNGGPDATFADVTHIQVDLGEGDDLVQLTDAVVQGNVHVETGAGADQVWIGHFPGQADGGVMPLAAAGIDAFLELEVPDLPVDAGPVGIGRNLFVETGDEADVVAISDALVQRNATINTGDGDDQVFILAASDLEDEVAMGVSLLPTPLEPDADRGLDVGFKLSIKLGDGADAVTMMHTSAHKGIKIHDPQTDTEIVLSNVDGGRRGIRIVNSGHDGDGHDDDGPLGDVFDRIRSFLEDLRDRFGGGNNGFGPFGRFG